MNNYELELEINLLKDLINRLIEKCNNKDTQIQTLVEELQEIKKLVK